VKSSWIRSEMMDKFALKIWPWKLNLLLYFKIKRNQSAQVYINMFPANSPNHFA